MGLLQHIIASFEKTPGKGIPLGNLTSQIFANVYLHELDRFILHTVKPLKYLRYGDDFVLFGLEKPRGHRLFCLMTRDLHPATSRVVPFAVIENL